MILEEILQLDPTHKDARNRLVALAKNSSPQQAFQMLPAPSDLDDSETKLYRAIVLTAVKQYQAALDVLATLHAAAFDSHFEARICRAKAFRGIGDYAPAYLHAAKAVEIQPCETSYLTRASIILEYWEWMRRKGLLTFGDDGMSRGLAHARLISGVPHSVIMLTESQNSRLGASSTASASPSSPHPVEPHSLESSLLAASAVSRSAAVTRSRIMASKAQIIPAKLPPISDLLSIALQDLNRVIDIRPSSIQALTKRATVLHVMGVYTPAIEDLNRVLRSDLLQPSERPRLVLKFARLLFDSEDYDNIAQAHRVLNNQLHISVDLDVLSADVAALMVIGSSNELTYIGDRVIKPALRSIKEREAHALPATSRGPLLLLLAKISKRLSELYEMDDGDDQKKSSTTVISDDSQEGASVVPQTIEKGSVERRDCIDYAKQAMAIIGDPRLLVRESAFWRQSGESELALAFAHQALIVDPHNLPAKLSKAAELLASGDEANVLLALHGLSDRDPQVRLYRVLASSYVGRQEKLEAIDAYLAKLVDSTSEFANTRIDIRMRCWTTAQFNRALSLWKLGDRESARVTLLDVLHSAPTHPGALIHLAELLVLEGELQTATYYFEKRLSQAYTRRLRIHLLMRIATCYQQLGSYEQCSVVLEEALKLDPSSQEALRLKDDAKRLNTRIGAVMANARETVSSAYHAVRKYWWTTPTPPSIEKAPQRDDHLA